MARIDFYVLGSPRDDARWEFACRLTEKAYRLDHTVHILAPDRARAEMLDELLWTWREGSFVPHALSADAGAEPVPVTIGHDRDSCRAGRDLLINLSDDLPDNIKAFPRVAEIVTSDDDLRRQSRARYASYREQGHTLDTHKL
ncbi:MAG: DNA polymerase III subunit chi [Woeseiaceae bacterium]|nr:DNA polymerase III subunit chi [Woeseiaceae bacterium]